MFDLGVIGAGPAGYAAAIRASQKGLKVVLFEKNQIGGTCLNKGCIPTKTILHSCKIFTELKNSSKYGIFSENPSFDFSKIQERQKTISEKIRKNLTGLIKNWGIEIVEAEAQIMDEHTINANNTEYCVKNIIIATGSKPNIIKFNGNYEENFILTSDDVLNLTQLPQHVLIVGSGAIGIEWARIFSCLGAKVSLIEMAEKLVPLADFEISDRLCRIFKRNRIEYYTASTINSIERKTVNLSNGKTLEPDFILLGTGRLPELDIGKYSEKLEIKKFINTEANFKTNIENIYAIGDVNGKSMLAHSAIKQAENVIDYITDKKQVKFSSEYVPSVIYGTPEIAWIGATEQELINNNIEYKKSIFPISALGKAYSEDKIEGFIKILTDNKQILGAHIMSEEASAMIQQIAIATVNNIPYKQLNNVIFAHPTYSEGIGECILGLDNIALHVPKQT